MKVVSIPGGWYLDSLPTGEYGCIIPTQKQVQTHIELIPYPIDEPLWLAITNSPSFKMIGQGHAGTGTWEYSTDWHLLPASCGVWPVIYDLAGAYHIAQCAPPTGSQGYRYVAYDGSLVTGDATIVVRNGLNEWTDLSFTQDGTTLIGQGHESEGACVWALSALRMLHPGNCFNIRAKYNRNIDVVSISFYEVAPDGIQGWVYWMSLGELFNLPTAKRSIKVTPFTHPALIAPFMAANSGSPDIFSLGVYTESEPLPASLPPDKRMLVAHDGATDWVPPTGMRRWDIPLIEYYRIPEETLMQSIARWKRQTTALLTAWQFDIGVIPMFYTQNRWTVQDVLDGISALSELVNLSPRIKLVSPFSYNRANGIIAFPELQEAFTSLQKATPGTPIFEPIGLPKPEPPKPVPSPVPTPKPVPNPNPKPMSTFPLARVYNSSKRLRPVTQQSLPSFDVNDSGGIVHINLPPEQVIPEHFTDPAWLRADFSGVTLPGNYKPSTSDDITRNGGVLITSGRWAGLFVPFLSGANTTPPTMIMTPMLSLYPRDVQDAVLTEHAERGYDDLIIAPEVWNDVGNVTTTASMLAWCQYVRSWGFRVVLWRGDHKLGLDSRLQTLLDAGVVSFYCHGEEVDSHDTAEGYEASLRKIDSHIGGRIPIGVHFTDDEDPRSNHFGMGYPLSFPRDTFLPDWSPYDGRVHLCLQLGVDISAGKQGAAMYYARRHVNCGIGDAARGPGAPNSRVIAWETMATAQLYGRCSEEYGCLRSYELICGTRDNPKALPVSGSANGLRFPNGTSM